MELTRSGGSTVLRAAARPTAAPAAGAVRIATEVAGVAYGDLLLREGLVRRDLAGVIPGYDAVGLVDAVGRGVDGIVEGTRVVVRTDGTGGYSSHVEAPATFAVPVPDGVASDVAVAIALNYVTAWQMLTRVAPVGAGGTVLVHGAAGGVGGALAELAALRGLTVLGTGSTSRLSTLRARGITALDRNGDWAAQAKKLVPAGLDAVFDGVGGRGSGQSFRLLGAGGVLVVYGVSSALVKGRRSVTGLARVALTAPRPSAVQLFRRGVGVIAYTSSGYVPAHPDWFRDDLAALLDLAAAGKIAPVVAARVPLTEAASAHRMLADGVVGKIVLTTGSGSAS